MRSNYSTSERLILAHEGGYSNNPRDPGGPTLKGVTQKVYDAWRTNQGLAPQDVRKMSDDECAAIYESQYWDQVHGDDLPSGLDYAAFDYAINSGPARAIEDLQRTVGAAVDGKYANMTVAAVAAAYKADPAGLIQRYCDRRLAFMKSLKQWATFKDGWERRVNEVAYNAKAMAVASTKLIPSGVTIQPPAGKPAPILVAPTPQLITPAPIGAFSSEQTMAKALPTEQLAHRTIGGLGYILSAFGGAGAIGQQALDAVDSVKAQIGDSPFGRLALVATVLLILVGGALVVVSKVRAMKEAKGS